VILFEGCGRPLTVHRHAPVETDGDDAAYEWLASQPPGALLNLPMSSLGGKFVLHAQFAALEHGHPLVDGVGRIDTPLVEWLSGSSSPLVVTDLLPWVVPFLRELGVRYIFVRPRVFFDPAIATRVIDTLARDDSVSERGRFGDVIVWEIGGRAALEPADSSGLERLPARSFTLAASDNPGGLSLMTDERLGTRWLTGRPQDGSEWLTIEFDRPRDIARIEFTMHARSVIHFPRWLEIAAGGGAAGGETVLYQRPFLRELGLGWRLSPEAPTASITLPPHLMSRLHLRQRGQAPQFWAVDELVLWERR
jgi:hypothetical protein